jgi:hypothetical protein
MDGGDASVVLETDLVPSGPGGVSLGYFDAASFGNTRARMGSDGGITLSVFRGINLVRCRPCFGPCRRPAPATDENQHNEKPVQHQQHPVEDRVDMHLDWRDGRRVTLLDKEPLHRCVGKQQREPDGYPARCIPQCVQQGNNHIPAK